MNQASLQRMIRVAVDANDLADTLPNDLLARLRLPGFRESIRFLHYPAAGAEQRALQERTHPAWRRMKFDELLAAALDVFGFVAKKAGALDHFFECFERHVREVMCGGIARE